MALAPARLQGCSHPLYYHEFGVTCRVKKKTTHIYKNGSLNFVFNLAKWYSSSGHCVYCITIRLPASYQILYTPMIPIHEPKLAIIRSPNDAVLVVNEVGFGRQCSAVQRRTCSAWHF